MLSNPNSATSKSPDRDHSDIRFDRTQVGVSMSNGVPKFLRLKNLEELGIAKSHQAVRHMQMHYGFPLGRLLGPGTKFGPKTRLTNGWPVGRSSRRSKHASARSGRLRRGACLPRARCLTGAPLEWSFRGGGHRTGSTNKTIEVCLLSLRLWPRLRLQCTGAGAARRTQRAGETAPDQKTRAKTRTTSRDKRRRSLRRSPQGDVCG